MISDHDSVVIPKKDHTYSATEYEYDENGHWQKCSVCQYEQTEVIHKTGGGSADSDKIRIVLTIPYSLKNTDSAKTRSYAVVRVHNGAAELLADTDNDEATITIETDMFSTYALVYKDTAKTGDQNPDDSNSGNTGGSSNSGTDNDSHAADAKKDSMTEQEKKELTAALVAWGRKSGRQGI